MASLSEQELRLQGGLYNPWLKEVVIAGAVMENGDAFVSPRASTVGPFVVQVCFAGATKLLGSCR